MGGMVGEHYVCILTALANALSAFASHICILGIDSKIRYDTITITITKSMAFQIPASGADISMAKMRRSLSKSDSTAALNAKQVSGLKSISAVKVCKLLSELGGTSTSRAEECLVQTLSQRYR